MKPLLLPVLLLFTGLTEAATAVTPLPPPQAPVGPISVLTSHVLDGLGGESRNLTLVVRNGHIESISPTGTEKLSGAVIDLRGYTVLPGFIDTHVHLDSHWDAQGRIATETESVADGATGIANAAWASLMGGFTTVQSVGDPTERPLRDAIRDRGFPGPRVLTSLAWIEGDPATSDDALRAMVQQRKAEGADLVKIFASSSQRVGATPTLTEHQLKVLCDEAKAVGLRSMVHAYRSQVAAAARAGCRQIEHATYASAQDVHVAVEAGAYLSPQVGLVVQNYIANQERYIGVGNYTPQGMQTMLQDLHFDVEVCQMMMAEPKAKIVFSTDATAGAHGRNAEEFFGRVQACGQTPLQALTSAQSLAADAIGLGDRIGRIAPGFEADLIALEGDPLQDLTAVRRVAFVMRGGTVYKWSGAQRP
jgi:imidazolonepropionase-like amidohydrolase